MNKKLLSIMLISMVLAMGASNVSATAAEGNVNSLCAATDTQLATGCMSDEDVQTGFTTLGTVGLIALAGLASLLILIFAVVWIVKNLKSVT